MAITCRECKASLADDAVYCSECGEPASEAGVRISPKPQDLDAILTSANLSRIRGNWKAAINQCAQVLEQDPENFVAHSLLGDVYAGRGQLEETVRWYEMALDIEPANKVCAEKLAAQRRKLAEINAGFDVSRGRVGWFDRFAAGQSFESFLRIAVSSLAALAILLLGFGLVSLIGQKPQEPGPGIEEQSSGPAAYPGAGRRPVAPPSTVPASERTEREVQALEKIRTDTSVSSRGITVDDATVDPRTEALLVTFRNPSGPVDKRNIILNAGAVAAAGLKADPSLALVTVRCGANAPSSTGKGRTDIIFVADITRESAGALKPDATAEQIDSVMRHQWWSPSLQ